MLEHSAIFNLRYHDPKVRSTCETFLWIIWNPCWENCVYLKSRSVSGWSRVCRLLRLRSALLSYVERRYLLNSYLHCLEVGNFLGSASHTGRRSEDAPKLYSQWCLTPMWQESAITVEHQLVGTSIGGQYSLHRAAAAFPWCSLDSQPVGRRIWPITVHVSLEVDLCWPADTVTLFARRFLLLCTSCWWTVICQSWLHVVECVQQWKWIHVQYDIY